MNGQNRSDIKVMLEDGQVGRVQEMRISFSRERKRAIEKAVSQRAAKTKTIKK